MNETMFSVQLKKSYEAKLSFKKIMVDFILVEKTMHKYLLCYVLLLCFHLAKNYIGIQKIYYFNANVPQSLGFFLAI